MIVCTLSAHWTLTSWKVTILIVWEFLKPQCLLHIPLKCEPCLKLLCFPLSRTETVIRNLPTISYIVPLYDTVDTIFVTKLLVTFFILHSSQKYFKLTLFLQLVTFFMHTQTIYTSAAWLIFPKMIPECGQACLGSLWPRFPSLRDTVNLVP